MDTPNEAIEINLEPHYVTIVSSIERVVQSVVVVQSDVASMPSPPKSARSRRGSKRCHAERFSEDTNLTSTFDAHLRSELLRPDSPLPERSSVFEGRRGGDMREQPPGRASRGREARISRERSIGKAIYRNSSFTSSRTRPTRRLSKSDRYDSFSSLPTMEEGKTYLCNSNKRIFGSFRNRKVGSVVMLADV